MNTDLLDNPSEFERKWDCYDQHGTYSRSFVRQRAVRNSEDVIKSPGSLKETFGKLVESFKSYRTAQSPLIPFPQLRKQGYLNPCVVFKEKVQQPPDYLQFSKVQYR